MGPVLPEIRSLSSSPDTARLALAVPADLRFFSGHFPGLGILPGVVQLHWAIVFAGRYLGVTSGVERITGLKFSRILRPGAEVTLVLERMPAGFGFRFESEAGTCSSGRFACAQ
jgi:3-hydroxymyristoyl/3-hydroxydecanoyl-(acyl carrier protein) dehydratase